MNKEIKKDGTIRTLNDKGQLHSYNDEPAEIWPDGSKHWYQNGKLHRDNDQPAVIKPNDFMFWCQNDELYRDNDKPAAVWSSGTKKWYQNGKFIDIYRPDFGCFNPKTKEEAMERLDSKPRPYSREMYLKDIERMFPDG